MKDESWRERAKCLLDNPDKNSHDPDFYPEVGNKTDMKARAKGKCFACDVRSECLDWALDQEGGSDANHRYGILGAMDPNERTTEYRNRREI